VSLSTSAILIVLGFIPSLVWLAYYLRKDIRPEPKYLIARVFLMGIIFAPLAVIAQWLFRQAGSAIFPNYQADTSSWFFLWAALVEEVVKFLAIRFVVLHDPEFDEPVDGMIYMITAALGFAAIENILVLFQTLQVDGTSIAIQIWILRFIGATLLHAVSSAIVGYFLALSWFYSRHSSKLIPLGVILATLVHFLFNILLLGGNGQSQVFIYATIYLVFMALAISILFSKLRAREMADLSTRPLLSKQIE
jgi:RsiW-degrading membrane proteinase PrsW (M82 family)